VCVNEGAEENSWGNAKYLAYNIVMTCIFKTAGTQFLRPQIDSPDDTSCYIGLYRELLMKKTSAHETLVQFWPNMAGHEISSLTIRDLAEIKDLLEGLNKPFFRNLYKCSYHDPVEQMQTYLVLF